MGWGAAVGDGIPAGSSVLSLTLFSRLVHGNDKKQTDFLSILSLFLNSLQIIFPCITHI